VTLFIVESNRPGFQRGRNLEKIGMKAQDTSELFFESIRIPAPICWAGRLADNTRSNTVPWSEIRRA